MRLAGQAAIVTGSSVGIGEAVAAAFRPAGAWAVVNSRRGLRHGLRVATRSPGR